MSFGYRPAVLGRGPCAQYTLTLVIADSQPCMDGADGVVRTKFRRPKTPLARPHSYALVYTLKPGLSSMACAVQNYLRPK